MSNALSIAAVTAVIKDLLENGLVSDAIVTSIGDVIVTALPPDRISVGGDERPQLNLFLYQVTQNRNAQWGSGEFKKQTRSLPDPRLVNPPLALDLHYLLTAYGAKDFQAELLLGYAMHMLHKIPVMSRDAIEIALKNAAQVSSSSALSQALTLVSIPDLARQIGQIKISTEFFSMEDTSKLWSSLQTNYRPSAAYQVSMVCIDSSKENQSITDLLPSFDEPKIDRIVATPETTGKIIANSTIIIRGQRLRSNMTRIRISGVEKLIEPNSIQDSQISLLLPAGLAAGIYSLQVIQLGANNARPTDEIASNIVPFVLHSTISATVSDSNQISEGNANLSSATITVKLNPPARIGQKIVLLLDRLDPDDRATYTFPLAPQAEDTAIMTVPVKNVRSGNYLVRVRVDGVENWLAQDPDEAADLQQVNIT